MIVWTFARLPRKSTTTLSLVEKKWAEAMVTLAFIKALFRQSLAMIVLKDIKILLNLKFVRIYTYIYLSIFYIYASTFYSVLFLDILSLIPVKEGSIAGGDRSVLIFSSEWWLSLLIRIIQVLLFLCLAVIISF